jgi:hypothetical protein
MPKKKDDISIDPKNKGKFTKWVKKNMPGKSTCDGADAVMKSKKKYKPAVVKMANYAKNFGCSVEGKGKGPAAMKEGPMANKFIGELTEARKAGKESFVVNGKTYKVKQAK